jgi:hypothetical protein
MLEVCFPVGHLKVLIQPGHFIILVAEHGHRLLEELDLCLALMELTVIQVADMVMHGRTVKYRFIEVAMPVITGTRRDNVV